MILYFGITQSGLINKNKNGIMIVFNRELKGSDFSDLKINEEELIFYKDNNIAYIIVKTDKNFIIRKYKIFNHQLIGQNQYKTYQQVIKSVL